METGLPFHTFRYSRKSFFDEATQKVVFHLLSHWIVWKPFVNTVKLCLVYNGPVYSGHSVPITVTGQLPENFQLPYIISKVDLYIAVTLHLTVTL